MYILFYINIIFETTILNICLFTLSLLFLSSPSLLVIVNLRKTSEEILEGLVCDICAYIIYIELSKIPNYH